jgi:hypothetical protein
MIGFTPAISQAQRRHRPSRTFPFNSAIGTCCPCSRMSLFGTYLDGEP